MSRFDEIRDIYRNGFESTKDESGQSTVNTEQLMTQALINIDYTLAMIHDQLFCINPYNRMPFMPGNMVNNVEKEDIEQKNSVDGE